ELYDAVTRMRVPTEPRRGVDDGRMGFGSSLLLEKQSPTFQLALNRLNVAGGKKYHWVQFPLRCPVVGFHRVQPWNTPDKCPRCGVYLERTVLPYRLWE
ncbi:MAG: hypothetical protein ACREP9_05685, partial [Candidatus Dormibacteraceae bacterium]